MGRVDIDGLKGAQIEITGPKPFIGLLDSVTGTCTTVHGVQNNTTADQRLFD